MSCTECQKKCLCLKNKTCECQDEYCGCDSCLEVTANQYDNFMNKYKVYKDDTREITHTDMGYNKGRWSIPKESYAEFIRLYKKLIKKSPLSMVERSPVIAPFFFDADFHIEEEERLYKKSHIKETIKRINNIVTKYYDINENTLEAFVFEKPSSTKQPKKDIYKDGYHVMYPYLILDVKDRYFVYHKFLETIENKNFIEDIPYLNEIKDIFDKSVIYDNGVLMYGSSKENREPYTISWIYTPDLDKIDPQESGITFDEIIDYTLMRCHDGMIDDCIKISDEDDTEMVNEIADIYMDRQKYKEKYKKRDKPIGNMISQNTNDKIYKRDSRISDRDILLTKKLVKILDADRAKPYDTWRDVGWCLYNIDANLLSEFLDFSRKAGKKFNQQSCEHLWNTAKNDGYGLSLGTLKMWGKEDNSESYEKIINEVYQDILEKLLTGTHDAVANFVKEYYKGRYVCTDIKQNAWYEFAGHKWILTKECSSLFENLSGEVVGMISSNLGHKINNAKKDKDGNDFGTKYISQTFGLTKALETVSFKSCVMRACAHKFYDPKFQEKLDSNLDLFGFENGVYDLKNRKFRHGTPDDYISITTGYNYDPNITIESEYVKLLIKFFTDVHPIDSIRNYVTRYISSCLTGRVDDQKFPFWAGQGGNGKSLTINLIEQSFGNYYSPISISFLTQKRAAAGNATPELADKRGKRIVTFAEPEKDDKIQVGKLKEFTGADTIQARPLYGEPFYYKPQFKLILATNKMPKLDVDGGVARRVVNVLWSQLFRDKSKIDPNNPRHKLKDKTLEHKFKTMECRQAFIWYLINIIYPQYDRSEEEGGGLQEPEEVTNWSNKYMKDNDRVGKYLEKCTINVDKDKKINFQMLYDNFTEYYKKWYNGHIPNAEEIHNYMENLDYRMEFRGTSLYIYGIDLVLDKED